MNNQQTNKDDQYRLLKILGIWTDADSGVWDCSSGCCQINPAPLDNSLAINDSRYGLAIHPAGLATLWFGSLKI